MSAFVDKGFPTKVSLFRRESNTKYWFDVVCYQVLTVIPSITNNSMERLDVKPPNF